MLHRDRSVVVTYAVFDVLAVEGLATTTQPYTQRRALLETLDLEQEGVQLVATFEDGAALFDAIGRLELGGVVAKRERDRYRAGERVWVKTQNRAAPRFEEERAGLRRSIEKGRGTRA
jgi:bifunctional non-homologous end joining protein LigD